MNYRSETVISNAIKELFEIMTVSAEENAKKKIKKNLDTIIVKERIPAPRRNFIFVSSTSDIINPDATSAFTCIPQTY
jgi:hypothetical protein